MTKFWAKSIGKFETPPSVNEDFAVANRKCELIAVSDGAGGGGVYADKWAEYLCSQLPDIALSCHEDLNGWIDEIWEEFYDQYEKMAKEQGGLLLQKFYEEGSYATIAASWIKGNEVRWITYGDSTVFLYKSKSHILLSSVTELSEYNNHPYLISTTSPLSPAGTKCGSWEIQDGDILICASDALSHFILMLYQVSHKDVFRQSIECAINSKSKNSNFISVMSTMTECSFENEFPKLIKASKRKDTFGKHLIFLFNNKLISHDDYSIAVCQY